MAFYTPTLLAPAGTRIRAEFNGRTIADSRNVLLFRESPFKLAYYFPETDVDRSLIDTESAKQASRKNGKLTTWTVRDGAKRTPEAAFAYTEPTEELLQLAGRIAFDFASMDRWFEEEEELLGHPRDPYTRIDVRRSSRHIEVLVEGKTIIDTERPFILTETGLPLRYYIPSNDVEWAYFVESDTQSICPYKGKARYWSAVVDGTERPDVVWAYPEPLQDAVPLRDCVGLYHEKLDVVVDGERPESWPHYFSK